MSDQGKAGWLRGAIAIGRPALAAWPHWEDRRPREALEAAERWLDGRADVAACAAAAEAAHACADELLHACGVAPAVAETWRGAGRVARLCALVASAAAESDEIAAAHAREIAILDEDRWTDPAARAAVRARDEALLRRFATEPVCGCGFGLPGTCWGRPYAPDRMCVICDDVLFHRHCMSCGAVVPGTSEPVEIRCAVCPAIELG